MIRPTGRAVLIFAGGIPLALFVVIYDPSLWVLSFNYGLLVALAAVTDVLLAFPPRLLKVKIVTPDKLYIGERGAVTLELADGRSIHRRTPSGEDTAPDEGAELGTVVTLRDHTDLQALTGELDSVRETVGTLCSKFTPYPTS